MLAPCRSLVMDHRHKALFLSINYHGWIEILWDKINSVIQDNTFNPSKYTLQEHEGHGERNSGPVKEEFLPYKFNLSEQNDEYRNFLKFWSGVWTGQDDMGSTEIIANRWTVGSMLQVRLPSCCQLDSTVTGVELHSAAYKLYKVGFYGIDLQ